MLIFAIVISIIAIICCSIAAVVNFTSADTGQGVVFTLLALLNLFLCITDINDYRSMKSGELKTEVVKNVVGYHADSTIVINGTDTTKVYTLTYWKNYE